MIKKRTWNNELRAINACIKVYISLFLQAFRSITAFNKFKRAIISLISDLKSKYQKKPVVGGLDITVSQV